MISWLIPSLAVAAANTLLIALLYFYIYLTDREYSHFIWGMSWAIYSFRFLVELLIVLKILPLWTVVIHQNLSLLGGYLFILGTYKFLKKPFPRVWPYLTIGSSIWTILAFYFSFSFLVANIAFSWLLGFLFFWSGILMYEERIDKGKGMQIASVSLIIWGIHKGMYPFFRTVHWVAPWGYLIASGLFLVTAIGKLLAHYEIIHNGMVKEMEERHLMEVKAIESERKHRTLLGNLYGMAYRCRNDQNWTMLSISEGCFQLTGYTAEELTLNQKISYNDLILPEDQESVWNEVTKALKNRHPFQISYRIRTASGEEKWVFERGVEVTSEVDGTQILEGYITDITNMENAKKGLNEQLQMLTLSSEIGQILSEGKPILETLQQCCEKLIKHLNVVLARIWLMDKKESSLILKASAGLYTHVDGKHSRIPLDKFKVGSIAIEKKPCLTNSVVGDARFHNQEWVKREGIEAFSGYPLMVEGKVVGVVAVFARHPLTHIVLKSLASLADGIALAIVRKQAEEELHSERDFTSILFNTTPAFVVTVDLKGRIIMINQTMLTATGYLMEEVIGADFISKFVPTEEIGVMHNIFAKLSNKKKAMWNEQKIVCKNGDKYDVLFHGQPVLNSKGDIDFFFGVGLDITERKKAALEKEDLEKQLQQAQKMEAIGTLAGGIAHDFNNILTAIYGYTELAFFNSENPIKVRRDLGEIKKGAERAKNLVQQILAFGRKTERETRPLQISLVVNEALKLIRSSIPSTIQIKQEVSSKGLVLADPTEIHQIVMNLCTNAYHAMRETGGSLHVILEDIAISESQDSVELGIGEGKYLLLKVIDTGIGMNEETKQKIFEPYFTTKGIGEGTGLGLAVVHGIVTSQGGSIFVNSERGRGTTFSIYFPVFEGNADNLMMTDSESPVQGGNEFIMLIDDDIKIIEITERTLKKFGYSVNSFLNGVDAFKAFKKSPEKYALVITDMTMPYMTGSEFSKKALEIRPDLPIILWTGHSELIDQEKAYEMGIKEFYYKPLTANQLLKNVRIAIDTAKLSNSNDEDE